MRTLLITAFLAGGLLAAGTAGATTLATSTFDLSDEGWRAGEFTQVEPGVPVAYDAARQLISSGDVAANAAFLAPAAYLGDKSAAFGGTLRFDLSSIGFDNAPYSAVALIGGGQTLYSLYTRSPATTLTPYSFTLVGATFKTGNPFDAGGTVATDAQLRQTLASLDQVAILVDWVSGGDFAQLDNVVLADANGPSAAPVPEPASWAVMTAGFGAIGGALRRRRRTDARLA